MNFTLIFFVQLTLRECIQTLMNSHSKSIFITVEQKHIHNLELLPLQLILNHKINCQPRRVSWHPPTAPAIKLNVDGSSLGNPRQSGYGSILPNNKGKWLLGFMGYSGYTINMNAEISTTYHGLQLCIWFGKLVTNSVDSTHPRAPLVSRIKKLVSLDLKFTFTRAYVKGIVVQIGSLNRVQCLLWGYISSHLSNWPLLVVACTYNTMVVLTHKP